MPFDNNTLQGLSAILGCDPIVILNIFQKSDNLLQAARKAVLRVIADTPPAPRSAAQNQTLRGLVTRYLRYFGDKDCVARDLKLFERQGILEPSPWYSRNSQERFDSHCGEPTIIIEGEPWPAWFTQEHFDWLQLMTGIHEGDFYIELKNDENICRAAIKAVMRELPPDVRAEFESDVTSQIGLAVNVPMERISVPTSKPLPPLPQAPRLSSNAAIPVPAVIQSASPGLRDEWTSASECIQFGNQWEQNILDEAEDEAQEPYRPLRVEYLPEMRDDNFTVRNPNAPQIKPFDFERRQLAQTRSFMADDNDDETLQDPPKTSSSRKTGGLSRQNAVRKVGYQPRGNNNSSSTRSRINNGPRRGKYRVVKAVSPRQKLPAWAWGPPQTLRSTRF